MEPRRTLQGTPVGRRKFYTENPTLLYEKKRNYWNEKTKEDFAKGTMSLNAYFRRRRARLASRDFASMVMYYIERNAPHAKAAPELDAHPEVVWQYDDFGTLLHYAAIYGKCSIVAQLAHLGSDINRLSQTGSTALALAVRARHSTVVDLLLIYGADIDILDATGKSSLQLVFEQNHFDMRIIRMFTNRLRAKTRTTKELVERLSLAGANMFHVATLGDVDLAKCMIERGLDINSRGYVKQTALLVAAKLNYIDLASWLISNGADVNASDDNGNSPLQRFAYHKNKNALKILLQHGADPNYKNRLNLTALSELFNCVDQGTGEDVVECIELLFDHGAIFHKCSIRYTNIFDIAVAGRPIDGINYLIKYLAILEILGVSIIDSVMISANIVRKQLVELKFENFREQCLQLLEICIGGKFSLLDFLEANEGKIRLLVRDTKFVDKLENVCNENKLRELYPYLYTRVTKKIEKASQGLEFEDEAIQVISKIFKSNYNLCYNFAREILCYLDESDLENLIQIGTQLC